MSPWDHWYHLTAHTYGSWLRGDPRGWRARHHREHVDGDYKHPPPSGKYEKLHQRSKQLMKRDPVHLARERCQFIVNEIAAKLIELGIELILVILDDHHLHLLASFPDHRPRHWIGMAKKHSSHMLRTFPDASAGGIWA